ISTGADGGIWSPDGRNIVFVSAVYPACKDDVCNKQRDEELKKSKVKAKIFSRLFYRHWNAFTEFKRGHLFAVPADGNGEPKDLTPGDHDVPPFHIGGQDMYAISPDGQELAYTSNIDEMEATSTNNEIFVVPISGGSARKISTSPGADTTPLYSPVGKYLAWRSQARGGFEADKWRLLVQDRRSGKTRDLTEKFYRSVGSFAMPWALPPPFRDDYLTPIFFSAEDKGNAPIFVNYLENEDVPKKISEIHSDDIAFGANAIFFGAASVNAPTEIYRLNVLGGEPQQTPKAVTHMNDALLAQIDMQPLESFMFKGANDEEVQGFILKPPGFDPNKKYPLKFLIHGGPQGAWGNSWTYRWNAELFAATGSYVVVMINFHGSTGYGQKFTDSISGDWGGKPYVDLMNGLDYVEKT